MTNPFKVGDVIEGYAGGIFGRDSYTDKTIEAIGPDWCVLRGGDSIRDRNVLYLLTDDDFETAMEHKRGPKRCPHCGHEEDP